VTIGERIRNRREQLNMSQDELAKKIGYKSRSSINKFETSRNLPLDKVELVAKALDCPPSYLMGWTDDELPSDNVQAYLIREMYKHFTPEQLDDPALAKQIIEFMDFVTRLDTKGRDALLAFAKTLKF
jgi:transcriptional regulator with XRE-family HTH domain